MKSEWRRQWAGGVRARLAAAMELDIRIPTHAPEPALHALAAGRSLVPLTTAAFDADLVVEARNAASASRFFEPHKTRYASQVGAVHSVDGVVRVDGRGRDDATVGEVREATSGHIIARRAGRARCGCRERGEGEGRDERRRGWSEHVVVVPSIWWRGIS